jgi:hypothetical protein
MAERPAACQLPNRVRHRPNWQLVLDMLDELEAWELPRRCWWSTPAMASLVSSAMGWRTARSLPGAGQGRHQRLSRAGAGPEQLPYQGCGRPSKPRHRQPHASVRQLALSIRQPVFGVRQLPVFCRRSAWTARVGSSTLMVDVLYDD